MNARYILAAALLVVSTAAYAEGSKTVHHHEVDTAGRHTGRDDLETACSSLAMQYEDNSGLPRTEAADKLHDEGVKECRAGSRDAGIEKLKEALQTIGATPELD